MKTEKTAYGTVTIGARDELFARAVALAEEHRNANGIIQPSWAMAGGSTPKAFFEYCRENGAIPDYFVEHGTWYTSDERMVPVSSDESNFGNLDRLLLKSLDIPEERKYPWPTDMAPHESARIFNELWVQQRGGFACFDICFLGMGDDCHMASLFPHSLLLTNPVETHFASVDVPGKGARLTITPYGLDRCGIIVVMAIGEGKALPLASVFSGISQPAERPAQLLSRYRDKVYWLLDDKAGARLSL